MSRFKIQKEEPMTIAQVQKAIEVIKKRDEELNFRTLKTEEYVNIFAKLSLKDSQELFKKLQELDIPRLKDVHIVKLVDLLPVHVEEVKVILQGYTITISQENMKKIAKTIEEFNGTKK